MAENRIRLHQQPSSSNSRGDEVDLRGWQLGGYTLNEPEPISSAIDQHQPRPAIRPQFIIIAVVTLLGLFLTGKTRETSSVKSMSTRVETVRKAYQTYLEKSPSAMGREAINGRLNRSNIILARIVESCQLYDSRSIVRDAMLLVDFDHDSNSPLYSFGIELQAEYR